LKLEPKINRFGLATTVFGGESMKPRKVTGPGATRDATMRATIGGDNETGVRELAPALLPQ